MRASPLHKQFGPSCQFRADCASGTIRLLPLTDAVIDRGEIVFTTAHATTYFRATAAERIGDRLPRQRGNMSLSILKFINAILHVA